MLIIICLFIMIATIAVGLNWISQEDWTFDGEDKDD